MSPVLEASIGGIQITVTNLYRIPDYVGSALKEAIIQGAKILDKAVKKNTSLTDHTLRQLADMGHPYAKKWGPAGRQIHSPYYQVHKQSGSLFSALYFHDIEGAGIYSFAHVVGVNLAIAPHALYVHEGTDVMIPRPFLRATLRDNYPKIQSKIFKVMGARRTWAAIAMRMAK